MTTTTTKGTIIEAANAYQERGVYERSGVRFIYTLDEKNQFCFCPGRALLDIDEAWAMGYRDEIARGTYQP
jgi:hypothetical protein